VTDRNPIEKGWLAALVAKGLDRHDAAAALVRLPVDVRDAGASSTDLAPAARLLVARSLRLRRLEAAPAGATAAFLDEVRLHVALLLDLAVLRGVPFQRARRRVEIAAFLAAAVGDVAAALEALPLVAVPADEHDVEDAFRDAERALAARFHPPGDPPSILGVHSPCPFNWRPEGHPVRRRATFHWVDVPRCPLPSGSTMSPDLASRRKHIGPVPSPGEGRTSKGRLDGSNVAKCPGPDGVTGGSVR
jgi:hypothetical protein